jgi:hypothetical protein
MIDLANSSTPFKLLLRRLGVRTISDKLMSSTDPANSFE